MTDKQSTGLSIDRPSRAQRTKEKLLQDVQGIEGQVKLNFNLPRSMAKKFKRHCLEEDRSMSDVIRDLLSTYLQKSTN